MFDVAEKEFEEVDIVCPGAGVYEPVSLDMILSEACQSYIYVSAASLHALCLVPAIFKLLVPARVVTES